MEVHDVERRRLREDAFEQPDVVRQLIHAIGIQSERSAHRSDEARGCCRIATRKQRDFMAEPYKFFGEIRNHSFGAAVEPGRDALSER